MVSDKGLVSVIVPVYKTEKYLHRCVDSILNQTYKDLEVILVDDGSPDNCPAICDEYAIKDNRVKVIHQRNRGQSSARNAGLDIASGDYIAFVDSDDWLDENMYQVMLDALQESRTDIACCGCYLESSVDRHVLRIDKYQYNSPESFLKGAIMGQNHALIALWSKLFKREVFNEIRIVENINGEDCVVAVDICAKYPKLIILEDAYYHYNKDNTESVTSVDSNPKEGFGKYLWLTKWLQLPKEFHEQDVVEKAKKMRLKFALRAYEMNYVKPMLTEERVNEIVKFLGNAANYNDVSSYRFLCWCFRNCRWVVNTLAKVRYGGK